MNDKDSILLVEDERLIRLTLRERLEREHYHVEEAPTGDDALRLVASGQFDLMLLDYRLPDMTGLDVLRSTRRVSPRTIVILITAYSSIDGAIEAIKEGAHHYMRKPIDQDQLLALITKALEARRLRDEVERLRDEQRRSSDFATLVGRSSAMRDLLELIGKVARSGASTVLVTGESGTGKNLAARAIHYASARADRPFVNVTCSALPEALLESELFGHERGAFTDAKYEKKGLLAVADGGTVLLDEIGDMGLVLQAKLLRFLEEKTFRRVGGTRDISVDVRVVAATHRHLEASVAAGAFREDLYYRLQVIPVHMPPLRERKDDIADLVEHFISRFSLELGKDVPGMTPRALERLVAYDWPGNVRELRNVIEHAMILGSGGPLDVAELPQEIVRRSHGNGVSHSTVVPAAGFMLPPEGVDLHEVEQQLVRQALELSAGNQSRAARLLGLRRDALRYRMKKFRLV